MSVGGFADAALENGNLIQTEEIVALVSKGKCVLVKALPGLGKVDGLGVFDPRTLIGREYGCEMKIGPHKFILLRPDLPLFHIAFRRGAQVITLKDAQDVVVELGIRCGSRVLEIGVGSGFMSSVLLWFVGEEGELVSYELRRDFADTARRNIEAAGLHGRWKLLVKNGEELDEADDSFDCAVVDVPEPWKMIEKLDGAVRPGGKIAFFVPTYNQLERSLDGLGNSSFSQPRAREISVREITTSRGAIRPASNMLAHTGFLLFARKLPR